MKIGLYGTDNYYSAQIPRIREGMIALGHEIVTDAKCDAHYANDPGGFDRAIQNKERFGGELILGIQDCPSHLSEFPDWIKKNKPKLEKADKITSISKYTQTEVKKWFGLDSTVIGQPIKNIYPLNTERNKFGMVCGRQNDPNKRFYLTQQAVLLIYYRYDVNLDVCLLDIYGSENPNIGKYHGIVSDEQLNIAYNEHKIVFISSKLEGLCLPVFEAFSALSMPIVCSDMTTALEFCPEEFICDPNPDSIAKKSVDMSNNYNKFLPILEEFGNKYRQQFSPKTISQNIINLV